MESSEKYMVWYLGFAEKKSINLKTKCLWILK